MSCDFGDFGDDITNCPVCFEPYTESGDHVPRILPCYETLCQKCIGKLLRRKYLSCPVCRAKHHAKKGVRSFQQNKYILTNIRKTSFSLKKEQHHDSSQADKCDRHGRERSLFCSTPDCRSAICPLCLSQDHRGHDVVDIQKGCEEMYNHMLEQSGQVKESLQFAKYKLESAKEELENSHALFVTCLKDQARLYIKRMRERLDKLVLDATIQKNRVAAEILAEWATICELKEDLEKKTKLATKTEESLTDMLKTLSDVDSCLSGKAISFQFCDKRTEGFSLGDIDGAFGDLVMKDMIVTLSRRKSQCTGTMTKTIETKEFSLTGLGLLDGDKVAVIGYRKGYDIEKENIGRILTIYDLHHSTSQDSAEIVKELEDICDGITIITLDGKQCIAVSMCNGDEGKIVFHDPEDLRKIVYVHSV